LLADVDGELRGTVTHASLKAVVDHYERGDWDADLVALTGDVVQDDTARAYQHCRALLEPIGLPVLCLPGNHDVRPLMREVLCSTPFRYLENVGIADWLLVPVDSCAEGRHDGEIAATELGRLARTLESATAQHVLVLLHHPPLEMGSEWLDSYGLANRDAFVDCVKASDRVRAVVFGHVHQAWHSTCGAIEVIGTPSTCSQFTPGSREFEIDDKPPGYRRIELNGDGSIDTEVVWVGND